MFVPSKFTRLEESTIFKMRVILEEKEHGETVAQALAKSRDNFSDASDFLAAMDVLFLLGCLDVQNETGVIEYA